MNQIPDSSSKPAKEVGGKDRLAAIACALLALLASLPAHLLMPTSNLDSDWTQVVQYAAVHRWQVGIDVVFTYGPLGILSVPTFNPATFWWYAIFHVVLGVSVCGSVYVLLRSTGAPWWGPVVALLLLIPPTLSGEILYSVTPVIWMFLALFPRSAPSRALVLLFSILAAAVALIKFSYFIMCGGVAGILLLDDVLHRRRFPMASSLFLGTMGVLWVASGQHLLNFPIWVWRSFQIVGAYGEAMATPIAPGDLLEILVFFVSASLLVGTLAWAVMRDKKRNWWSFLPVLGLSFILFLYLKAGFVRDDAGHASSAMYVFPLLAVFVLAGCAGGIMHRKVVVLGAILMLFSFGAFAYCVQRHGKRELLTTYYGNFYRTMLGSFGLLTHPFQTLADLSAQREAALADIRTKYPLPAMDGPVDLYSCYQSVLLAHGFDYAPRPVFQSYSAYSDKLAGLNAEIRAPRRVPKHILMDGVTLDSRYPSTDDGQSWPVILENYDLEGVHCGFAHFVHSDHPRKAKLAFLEEKVIGFSEEFELPRHDGPIWAEIEIGRTGFGSALNVAFKLPVIYADVTAIDGTNRRYRILPAVVRKGLLLTPLVGGDHPDEFPPLGAPDDVARLARNEPFPASHSVASLRFHAEWMQGAIYKDHVKVRLYALGFE